MDDVLRHIVLAPRDENLGAEHTKRSVILTFRARAHERQIRSRLRLRQIHRAGPRAFDQLRQIARLQVVRARDQQRLDRAIGQQRTQRERKIRRVQHLDARRRDQLREPLSAEPGRMTDALPPAFRVLAVSIAETGRGLHVAVMPCGRLPVALHVQRADHFGGELRAFFEDRAGGIEIGIVETGKPAHARHVRQVLDHEHHVFDGRGVAHRCLRVRSAHRAALALFKR